jgi:hypothetical protein
MKKLPKLTIKFFLHKNLSPIRKGGKEYYPLYILVTYHRKSTQLKSKFGDYSEDLESLNKKNPGLLEFEERILRKMIEYETELKGNKFSLVGLSERYEHYATSIYGAVQDYLKERLEKEMKATFDPMAIIPDYHNPQIGVSLLYMAALRLLPDFDKKITLELKDDLLANEHYYLLFPIIPGIYSFPTVIDWENGDHKQELAKEYTALFGFKLKQGLDRITALIDRAIG